MTVVIRALRSLNIWQACELTEVLYGSDNKYIIHHYCIYNMYRNSNPDQKTHFIFIDLYSVASFQLSLKAP